MKKMTTTDKLLSKLRQPIHVTYISKYILKKNTDETKKILKDLINEGLIEESGMGKEYYVVK